MPATSEKQKRFMDAAAHNPEFAKEAGVPMKVAKEFSEASKGMKFDRGAVSQPKRQGINNPKTNHGAQALFSKGGTTMDKDDIKQDKKLIKRAFGMHDKQSHEGKKTDLTKLAKGGSMKETMGPRTMSMDVEKGSNKLTSFGQSAVQKRGLTKGTEERNYKTLGAQGGAKSGSTKTTNAAPVKMARGGGVETKGKTKGKMIAMCGGGMSKKK